MFLAYGDIFFYPEGPSVSVISSGPKGITVSVTASDQEYCTVTVDGAFPDSTGTLLVSLSTGDDSIIRDRIVSGRISSWSAEQIVFTVSILDVSEEILVAENFSFVLLGE